MTELNPKYLERLGEHKEKYLKNLRAANRNTPDKILMINHARNFSEFILFSFLWYKTPEGYEFWKQVSIKQ